MENSILSKMYDDLISENVTYNEEIGCVYKKIRKKYKKCYSLKDENEFFCDVAELVHLEQKRAFEIGVKFAFRLLKEVSAV